MPRTQEDEHQTRKLVRALSRLLPPPPHPSVAEQLLDMLPFLQHPAPVVEELAVLVASQGSVSSGGGGYGSGGSSGSIGGGSGAGGGEDPLSDRGGSGGDFDDGSGVAVSSTSTSGGGGGGGGDGGGESGDAATLRTVLEVYTGILNSDRALLLPILGSLFDLPISGSAAAAQLAREALPVVDEVGEGVKRSDQIIKKRVKSKYW